MKEKSPPGFTIYLDDYALIEGLTNEEKGELLSAMMVYSRCGRILEQSERVSFILNFFLQKIDREKTAYQKTCLRNAYIAAARQNSITREEWISNNPKTIQVYSEDIISDFLSEEKNR